MTLELREYLCIYASINLLYMEPEPDNVDAFKSEDLACRLCTWSFKLQSNVFTIESYNSTI